MLSIPILYPTDWKTYELLDSGKGEKLERFDQYTVIRPDPRILWKKSQPKELWDKADATYQRSDPTSGSWHYRQPPPSPWTLTYEHLSFLLKPTSFKHVGIFPEQAVNWDWLAKTIANRPLRVLNLFAYTGGATLAATAAGAQVTHVDAAKSTIAWARENAKLSGLDKHPVRWIEDDAYKFVLREAKRSNTYDGIILDPPRFGRGTKGEVWKIEVDLPKLLTACRTILSKTPQFFLINAYTADLSALVMHQLLTDIMQESVGIHTCGELALKESGSGRLVPNGIFARWNST